MRLGAATVRTDAVRLLKGEYVMSFFGKMDAWLMMENNFKRQISRLSTKTALDNGRNWP